MTKPKPKKLPHNTKLYMSRGIVPVLALLSFMFLPIMKSAAGQEIVIYKSPTCGCCTKWASYLEDNGFSVTQIKTQNLNTLKQNQRIPSNLSSCHTAIVDGYIVEGHVPVNAINRMLKEKPAIKGITVPGMPIGSPGMEQGTRKQPYDVLAIHADGSTAIYESHRN